MQHPKITAIGNSAGVILPKAVRAQSDVDRGDTWSVARTANGIELSPYDPTYDERMKVAREIMARYRNRRDDARLREPVTAGSHLRAILTLAIHEFTTWQPTSAILRNASNRIAVAPASGCQPVDKARRTQAISSSVFTGFARMGAAASSGGSWLLL